VITHQLIQAITEKSAIPFLGAGASKEALDADGNSPPNADQLRNILAQKFFGKQILNRDLMAVAEMAIRVRGGEPQVYEEVLAAFRGFKPSEAHCRLAEFHWSMIVTTNYDCLLEQAYRVTKSRAQDIVPFVKDKQPIEQRLRSEQNPVLYLKLHGCLDHIDDKEIPLVLSREQYAKYSANRTRLFGRLNDSARESTLIFIGYRLDDPHIRNLIYSVNSKERPRWYIVTPDAEDYEIEFWGVENVGVIKSRFGAFMEAAGAAIPPLDRLVVRQKKPAESMAVSA
jgi:hypothetical protein